MMNYPRFRDPDLDPAWRGDDEEDEPTREPCPVCSYGEPSAHTCDEGQRARYAVEIRGRIEP